MIGMIVVLLVLLPIYALLFGIEFLCAIISFFARITK